MKPVIFAFLALVVVILGVGWMNGKFGNKPIIINKTEEGKVLYFDKSSIEFEKETEVGLLADYNQSGIASYWIEFGYDPSYIKISRILVDPNVFGTNVKVEIDDNFGKVKIVVTNDKNGKIVKPGVQKLAIIKMTGLKKGKTMLSNGRRPEVTVFENNRYIQSDFKLNTFVMSIK